MNAVKRATTSRTARAAPTPRPPARPRPTGEAARSPHPLPTERARHAVGEAAQRDRTLPELDDASGDGGDWLAERLDAPAAPPRTAR